MVIEKMTEPEHKGFFEAHEADTDFLSKEEEQYTVFLVEDDTDDQKLTARILQKSPYIYNIHCFGSGDDLIRHFTEEGFYSGNLIHHLPLLVMLDIHLPGTNGIEVLRALKNHPLTDDIPVIVLTADMSDRVALDAYKSQANAFIIKPLNLEHVHEVIYKGYGWPNNNKPS